MSGSSMRKGRPPAWLLDPSDEGATRQDVADVDDRGRLTIPLRLLEDFPGIDARGAGQVLIETLVPGAAVLRDWSTSGEEVLKRRRALVSEPTGENADLVRALDDAFRRGRLDAGGRLTLPPPVVGHLSGSFRVRGLFVVRHPDRLDLWSRNYRAARLKEVASLLDLE